MILAAALLLLQDPPKEEKPKLELVGRFTFGGRSRAEHLSPVEVVVKNPLKDEFKELDIHLRWGAPAQYQPEKILWATFNGPVGPVHELTVTIPPYSNRRYLLSVETPADPSRHSLWAFLMRKGETLYAFEINGRPIHKFATCIAVVGSDASLGFPRPRDTLENSSVEIVTVAAADLPERWTDWTFADAVVWLDADPADARDPAQVEALRLWVAGGGRLVVSSNNPDHLLAGALRPLLPAEIGRRGSVESIDLDGLRVAGPVAIAETTPSARADRVERRGETPVLIEHAYGRGRVTLLPFSARAPGFSDSAEAFWRRRFPLLPPKGIPDQNFLADDALDDQIGSRRLTEWVSDYSKIPPPKLDWAFTLILIYIALVGPIDYLILRQLNRMYWTWFTFTSYVVGFSAAALIAGSKLADHPSAIREFTVLDCAPDAQVVRGVSIAGVLSPLKESFTIEPQGPGEWARVIDRDVSEGYDDLGSVSPIRITFGETRTLTDWDFPNGQTRWAVREWCEAGPPPVSAELVEEATGLTIKIHSTLEEPIKGAVLYTEGGVYRVGEIPNGAKTLTLSAKPEWSSWEDYARSAPPDIAWVPTGEAPDLRHGLRAAPVMAGADVSDWVSGRRAILIGRVEGGENFHFNAKNPGRSSVTIVRVFLRAR